MVECGYLAAFVGDYHAVARTAEDAISQPGLPLQPLNRALQLPFRSLQQVFKTRHSPLQLDLRIALRAVLRMDRQRATDGQLKLLIGEGLIQVAAWVARRGTAHRVTIARVRRTESEYHRNAESVADMLSHCEARQVPPNPDFDQRHVGRRVIRQPDRGISARRNAANHMSETPCARPERRCIRVILRYKQHRRLRSCRHQIGRFQ